MATSKRLHDQTTRNAVFLEGLKSQEVKEVDSFLRDMNRTLRDRLSGEDLTEYTRARTESLIVKTERDLIRLHNSYGKEFRGRLEDIGQYQAEFEVRNLDEAIEDERFEGILPSDQQIRAAIFSTPLAVRGPDGGKLIEDFIGDWSTKQTKQVTGAIRQGFYEGQTTAEIMRRIRGTKAAGYRDGILNTSRREAETIVRTAVQHASSEARFATLDANEDVLEGYRWVSTLDGKTSTQCRSLDNQVFRMNQGPRPPVHYRCRSTVIAEVRPEYKLYDDAGTRASQDGPVSGDLSYYDWLKDQPEAFQDEVLGLDRAILFRRGGLTPDQFARLQIGRNFMPLTLEQMKRREPLAFARAFDTVEKPRTRKRAPAGTTAKSWNTHGFAGARPSVQRLAKEYQDIDVTREGSGAWARAGHQINMPNKYRPADTYSLAVWRHEMGHIIDVNQGKAKSHYYLSGTREWQDARKSATKHLKVGAAKLNRPKMSRAESESYRVGLYASRSEDLLKLRSGTERYRYLQERATAAGLDLDKLEGFLRDTSGVLDNVSDLSAARQSTAQRLSAIITAIELGDAEKFATYWTGKDLIETGATQAARMRGAEITTVARMKGAAPMFSDMIGAITNNSIMSYNKGWFGHSASYYRKRGADGNGTEMFANLTALYGDKNRYTWEIVKRFAPEPARLYEELLDEF